MLLLFGRFYQWVDDITENVQRSIDIAAFPQSFALDVGMFDSLASRQIDYINLGFPNFYNLIFDDLWLDDDCEYGMRAWTFSVHGSGCHLSGFVSFE